MSDHELDEVTASLASRVVTPPFELVRRRARRKVLSSVAVVSAMVLVLVGGALTLASMDDGERSHPLPPVTRPEGPISPTVPDEPWTADDVLAAPDAELSAHAVIADGTRLTIWRRCTEGRDCVSALDLVDADGSTLAQRLLTGTIEYDVLAGRDGFVLRRGPVPTQLVLTGTGRMLSVRTPVPRPVSAGEVLVPYGGQFAWKAIRTSDGATTRVLPPPAISDPGTIQVDDGSRLWATGTKLGISDGVPLVAWSEDAVNWNYHEVASYVSPSVVVGGGGVAVFGYFDGSEPPPGAPMQTVDMTVDGGQTWSRNTAELPFQPWSAAISDGALLVVDRAHRLWRAELPTPTFTRVSDDPDLREISSSGDLAFGTTRADQGAVSRDGGLTWEIYDLR